MALVNQRRRHPLVPFPAKSQRTKSGQRVIWIYGGRIPHVYSDSAPAAARAQRVVKLYGGKIPHSYVA
jgi:hypothetical protein